MEQVELAAQVRADKGSSAARRLRREGWVTANLYGKEMTPVMLQINARSLRDVLGPTGAGHNLLTLKVDGNGQGATSYTAVVKEVQRNPLTRAFVTVDFQSVSLTERITAIVVLALHGTPVGTKDGGIVEHFLHEVEVQCQAQHLPERLVHDLTGLKVHDSLYVRDLAVPEGVTILNEADEVILSVTPPRLVVEPEVAAEPAAAEPEVIQRGKKVAEDEK